MLRRARPPVVTLCCMPTVTTVHVVPQGDEARWLAARDDDLVVEEVVTDPPATEGSPTARFDQVEGPFRHYRREVRVERAGAGRDGRVQVTETVRARIDVPYWSWLLDRGARWALPTRHDGTSTWWTPPCRLDRQDARMMGSAAMLAVAAGYLGGIVVQFLTYIGADLGAQERGQSVMLAVLRIGGVLTAVAMAMADRRGRRSVTAWCLSAAVAANVVTAVAPDLTTVTVSQTLSRGIVAAAALLVPVLAVEELPAAARAWSVGVVFMAGSLGVGMALMLLPLMRLGPGWWRLPFALSLLALPVIRRCIGRLPESRRFRRHRSEVEEAGHETHHMSSRRLLLLGAVLFLLNLFVAPASQLQNQYLRAERDFAPELITAFVVLTNSLSGVSVLLAGRLADRRSRHLVAPVGLIGLAVGNALMFATAGLPMWMGSFVGSFVGAACVPGIGVLSPELFPTGRRGTAAGLLNAVAIVGSVVGLLAAGAAIDTRGYGWTFAVLAVAPLLAVPLVRALPEGARRGLEDLNPDERPGA